MPHFTEFTPLYLIGAFHWVRFAILFIQLEIMRLWVTILLSIFYMTCKGQSTGELRLKGNYSALDSIQITDSYYKAHDAVHQLLAVANSIWDVKPQAGQSKKTLRKDRWENEDAFVTWLGKAEKIRLVRRRIRKIHNKFRANLNLVVTREDKGKCNRWVGAWAIPFGKIKIILCENFFHSVHLQEKIIVHELGHEAGILFHRGIHNCRAAKRAATAKNNVAKRSTENYAWLAVSYLGKDCTY